MGNYIPVLNPMSRDIIKLYLNEGDNPAWETTTYDSYMFLAGLTLLNQSAFYTTLSV